EQLLLPLQLGLDLILELIAALALASALRLAGARSYRPQDAAQQGRDRGVRERLEAVEATHGTAPGCGTPSSKRAPAGSIHPEGLTRCDIVVAIERRSTGGAGRLARWRVR